MFNLIDVILLGVIALTAFVGYKAGFVKTVIGLLSFAVALGIALIFYKPLAVILAEKTSIDEWIVEKITTFEYKAESDTIAVGEEEKTEVEEVDEALSHFPALIAQNINIEEQKKNIKQDVANKVSDVFMKLMSLIVIYVVIRVTLLIAEIVLNGMMQIPVLKQVNEILGLIFGALIGFSELYIAFAFISLLSSITDIAFVVDAIKASMFAKWMFEYNLILKLLF